jgi:hypothetical protein
MLHMTSSPADNAPNTAKQMVVVLVFSMAHWLFQQQFRPLFVLQSRIK